MEVWELLRPSFRRLAAISVAALVAAVAAVVLAHAKSSYQGKSSVYFAQALGVDSTSYSVDPTAAQLQGVLALPAVQTSAAQAADVPLSVVHAAAVAHTAGSPILTVTAKDADPSAAGRAAPALARAGLAYFAQQSVDRAQSVEKSAVADLGTANTQLQSFVASAGVADVDTAVATATAAVAAQTPGTAAGQAAAATLARLEALQPQYDLLQTEVTGARTAIATAYTAVNTARSVASAVALPGNVVTDPPTKVSGFTAVVRAAVSAIVVVFLVGIGGFGLLDLRRRRRAEERGSGQGPSLARPNAEALPAPARVGTGAGDDFPLLLGSSSTESSTRSARSVEPAPATAELPAAEPDNPYLAQAKRLAAERSLRSVEARSGQDAENRRREIRTALMNASRSAEARRTAVESQRTVPSEPQPEPLEETWHAPPQQSWHAGPEEPSDSGPETQGEPAPEEQAHAAAQDAWHGASEADAPPAPTDTREDEPAEPIGPAEPIEPVQPAQPAQPDESVQVDEPSDERTLDLWRVGASRNIEVRLIDAED